MKFLFYIQIVLEGRRKLKIMIKNISEKEINDIIQLYKKSKTEKEFIITALRKEIVTIVKYICYTVSWFAALKMVYMFFKWLALMMCGM